MDSSPSELPPLKDVPTNLFVNHQGKAISFRMRPCAERVRLRRYVHAGGGKLTSVNMSDQTVLTVLPNDIAVEENSISSEYLWACIRAGRMVSMSKFHVPVGTRAQDAKDVVVDVSSLTGRGAGRNVYTAGDDEQILRFLITANKDDFSSLTDVFRRLSASMDSNRSWESIKTRVLRHLAPKLNQLLAPDDAARVQRLLDIGSQQCSSESSESSESPMSGDEMAQAAPTTVAHGMRSLMNLPKDLSRFLTRGESLGWTHSQSAILLWMTSCKIDVAEDFLESKQSSAMLWTPELDRILTGGNTEDLKDLFTVVGQQEAIERLRFLECCDDDISSPLQSIVGDIL